MNKYIVTRYIMVEEYTTVKAKNNIDAVNIAKNNNDDEAWKICQHLEGTEKFEVTPVLR